MSKVVAWIFVLSAAAATAGCGAQLCAHEDDEETDPIETVSQDHQAIVGGEVDSAHSATVALMLTMADGSRGLCSGAIIGKDDSGRGYVLTAAHCVEGTVESILQATDFRDCWSGGNSAGCQAVYQPVAWKSHPSYDPITLVHDIAIVAFDGATAATPVVPPAESFDGLAIGSEVELSGYGRTYAGNYDKTRDQSVRNHVFVELAVVTDKVLRVDGATGKTACFGDSGGPAYGVINGELRVVGVASSADEKCELVANYARVSADYESFIAPEAGLDPEGAAALPSRGVGEPDPGDVESCQGADQTPQCSASHIGASSSGEAALMGLACLALVMGRKRRAR